MLTSSADIKGKNICNVINLQKFKIYGKDKSF